MKKPHRYKTPKSRRDNKLARRRLTSRIKRLIHRRFLAALSEEKREEIRIENSLKQALKSYKTVHAPRELSMISNTEQTLEFISELENYFNKRKKVFVDLSHVRKLGNGAILVLLSQMIKFKSNGIDFNGNFPKDNRCRKQLKDSGFIPNLYEITCEEEDKYVIGKEGNKIYTHGQKNVNPILSNDIISYTSERVWGTPQRCIGVQRALIELMQNTNNHAAYNVTGEKHWWLCVDYDNSMNKVYFSFIDFGVGVFRSLENKQTDSKFYRVLEKLKNIYHYGDNAELLKLLLNGEVHKTASQDYYRGKGLPGIVKEFHNNSMSNLTIITNEAIARLATQEYKVLKNPLNGTFVAWEIDNSNKHLPYIS